MSLLSLWEGWADFSSEQNKEKIGSMILIKLHSDVCGKVNTKSLVVQNISSHSSRYAWVYLLKKSPSTLELKAMVENGCSRKLKVLISDNGGEYIGKQ